MANLPDRQSTRVPRAPSRLLPRRTNSAICVNRARIMPVKSCRPSHAAPYRDDAASLTTYPLGDPMKRWRSGTCPCSRGKEACFPCNFPPACDTLLGPEIAVHWRSPWAGDRDSRCLPEGPRWCRANPLRGRAVCLLGQGMMDNQEMLTAAPHLAGPRVHMRRHPRHCGLADRT